MTLNRRALIGSLGGAAALAAFICCVPAFAQGGAMQPGIAGELKQGYNSVKTNLIGDLGQAQVHQAAEDRARAVQAQGNGGRRSRQRLLRSPARGVR